MAQPKKERPYLELGRMLESWRSDRYRSALALFKDDEGSKGAKFSFSYRAYSDFEGGVTLPSIEALMELATFFGKTETDRLSAALVWAKTQMPTAELRDAFDRLAQNAANADSTADPTAHPRSQAPAPAATIAPVFENTWVFGLTEKKLFDKIPWIGSVFASLMAKYPNEASFEELKELAPQNTLLDLLRPAIEAGYVIPAHAGLRLKHPFIHIPETAEWHEVRSNNVRHALDKILKIMTPEALANDSAHRQLIVRKLAPREASAWIAELKNLEERLETYSAQSGSAHSLSYVLAVAFGPRTPSGPEQSKNNNPN